MFGPSAAKEFRDRLGNTRAGLMEVNGRPFPMLPNVAHDNGRIWFLTANGTDAAAAGAVDKVIRFASCDTGAGLHGTVSGRLSVSGEKEKRDEVWNFVAASWCDEGKENKGLVPLRFVPSEADLWLSRQSGAVFLYETLKANLTDTQPDIGTHVTVTF